MSHTNSTTNYSLPQFTGSDKPAWLTDINGAFSAIDTAIKNAADTATAASGSATTANTSIGTLTNLNTTEKTNLVGAINEVNTSVGTVAGLANQGIEKANAAKSEADGLSDFLDINTFSALTTTSSRANIYLSEMRSAVNADGSLGKIYGKVYINNAQGTTFITVTISDTGLRPATQITINDGVTRTLNTANGFAGMDTSDLVINTDGTATFTLPTDNSITETRAYITPYVIFAKNFGDQFTGYGLWRL